MTQAGDQLWVPPKDFRQRTHVAQFMAWLKENRGHDFTDYHALWAWSAESIEDFWASIWDYFDFDKLATRGYDEVLSSREMPGARWFSGARLNYARVVFAGGAGPGTAMYAVGEQSAMRQVSWDEMKSGAMRLAESMRELGIGPGDRVASYLPNVPETMMAFLATASIGAIWSSCSPDFGADSVVDRFAQIEPKLLFATDGYVYGGKTFDRRDSVRDLVEQLPGLAHVVYLPGPAGDGGSLTDRALNWDDLLDRAPVDEADFEFADTDFSDPLWIVYSSGTTGAPKAFVHSHGGAAIEGMKFTRMHLNLGAESCLFFFTTTGWIMWNLLGYGLLAGSSILLVDGNPAAPEPDALWKHAADAGATLVGASPAFLQAQMKLGIVPREKFDLSRVDTMLMSGAPVSPEQTQWCYDNVQQDMWFVSTSGGTDIASGFVGGVPILPCHAGEIQTRCLGVDVHALDDAGRPLIDEVGELVVRNPMPSMPIYFWGDPDFKRYRDAYFDVYPGWWRHGDFLKINKRGGCFILGRSDSTLNRHGIRIGTAEIYRVTDDIDAIADSIIVNLDVPDRGSFMPLFVTMPDGAELTDTVRDTIRQALRSRYSPRHVPDSIIQAPGIPYTLTGKRMEVPLRKILLGAAPEEVSSPDAMQNPDCLAFYSRYRDTQTEYRLPQG
ncbi:MAG: acetoacetate--CoA ligase [Salinisphaeraceae bacterium]|nr:acetoacetate--CoA ligase [Salinisphaeraceae bacterium]